METYKAILYSRPGCPYCKLAKQRMRAHRVPYQEVSVPYGTSIKLPDGRTEGFTFPQIYLSVGGSDSMDGWLPKPKIYTPVKKSGKPKKKSQ